MRACRPRRSFLIEDILGGRCGGGDAEHRGGGGLYYWRLSEEPRAPLTCSSVGEPLPSAHPAHPPHPAHPVLCPRPLRAPACPQQPPAFRHVYALDPGGVWWCGGGGGGCGGGGAGAVGARRAGGQVRFTAAQSGALERRFTSHRYLSADQRRRLALELRLTDRQVKTWFQNRRAKWRRSAPQAAGGGTEGGRSPRRSCSPPRRSCASHPPPSSPHRYPRSPPRPQCSPPRPLCSPLRRPYSPQRRSPSPQRRPSSPQRQGSPIRRSCSPQRRPCSPQHRPCSPQRRPCSPQRRPCSPQRRPCSPQRRACPGEVGGGAECCVPTGNRDSMRLRA